MSVTTLALFMAHSSPYRPKAVSRRLQILHEVIGPAVWLLSRPFVWLYRFANLVFNLDERAAASNLKGLTKEVESDCACLLSKYGGRIVPELSCGSKHMDFATVVVEVRSLQLRASRERGFTSWEITSSRPRDPWQSLEDVCRRFTPKEGSPPSTFQLLIDHLPEIEHLLSNSESPGADTSVAT